jgi:hypothetical protein
MNNCLPYCLSVICVLTLAVSDSANASNGYKCTVKDAATVENGKLALKQSQSGMQFVVDRANGRMFGESFSSSGWQTIQILDKGSRNESFKVQYLSSPFVHVRLLVVNEFEDGAAKNFSMLDGPDVYAGTCVGLN